MKKVLGLALLCIFSSTGVYALEVKFMIGDVTVIRGGTKIASVNIGTAIRENDTVITGKKSTVTMAYADGSEIKMQESAKLIIGRMPKGSDAAPICVAAGAVTTRFAKIAKGSDARRSVYTPTTVCAVRGTEFDVYVSDGGDSRVDLTEGSLDVHNPYGGQQIEAGQNLEAGIAQSPAAAQGDAAQWKADKDTQLSSDASGRGEAYDTYMKNFSSRGKANTKSIDGVGRKVKAAKDSAALESSGKEIEGLAGSVEEDFYLSATAGAAIEAITDRFKSDKSDMYAKFLKLKEESNRVKDQLRCNYEAIQAVRESYRKAKDEIIGRQKEDAQKIKGAVDLQNVKPKIEKKPVKSE